MEPKFGNSQAKNASLEQTERKGTKHKITRVQKKCRSMGACLKANPLGLTSELLQAAPGHRRRRPGGALSVTTGQPVCCYNPPPAPHLVREKHCTCSYRFKLFLVLDIFFLFTVDIQRREPHSAHLPTVQPYTVCTPVRRASVLPPTRRCKASLRLLCSGLRVELLSGTGRAPAEGPGLGWPWCSNCRVAAMWRSFCL